MTPERYASTLSKLTFSWMDALTLKGWKNILKTEDMYSLMIGNRQVRMAESPGLFIHVSTFQVLWCHSRLGSLLGAGGGTSGC